MKVLVLSLLRIGDFFQHLRLIDDLRLKYPKAQIEILVNEGIPVPESLKTDFKFIFFPRQKIQQALTSSQEHSLKALQILERFFSELNEEAYFHIVDLTHTKLSYNVFRDLAGSKEWGPKPLFHHYLNETIEQPLLKRSLVQTIGQWQGLRACSRHHHSVSNQHPCEVLFQVCTSDPKKDWPISHWQWLSEQLTDMKVSWRVICAPFEIEKIKSHFPTDRIWVCGFDELAVPFSSGEYLLVSGDTSVLHWASVFEAPSLGLFVGSANVLETFPLTEGARLLSPRTKCWPCRHSQNCSQSNFFCHEDISPQHVLEQINVMLSRESLEAIQPSLTEANVWIVEKSNPNMDYHLRLISGGSREQQIQEARDLMELTLSALSSGQPDLSVDLDLVPLGFRRTFAEVLHRVMDSSGRTGVEPYKIKELAASSC